jgi:hypothetical protein
MLETLQIPIPSERRENRYKNHPLWRLLLVLAVLIGLAVVIAMTSRNQPARYVASFLLLSSQGSYNL